MMHLDVPPRRMLGLLALLALLPAAMISCDATEPSDVREDTGVAGPPTARSEETPPPTVAPPSAVEIEGDDDVKAADEPVAEESPSRSALDETWTQPEDPKTTRFLGLVADKPVTWLEHPKATSMELTRFTVPGKDGSQAGEIVVFYFGAGMGGSVDDNIVRWQNQFRPNEDDSPIVPEVSSFEVSDDISVTLVEFEGDWVRMGATSYTPDQLFVAAIVECPRGPLFIRLVGDKATVAPNREAFINMMKSLRVDESAGK